MSILPLVECELTITLMTIITMNKSTIKTTPTISPASKVIPNTAIRVSVVPTEPACKKSEYIYTLKASEKPSKTSDPKKNTDEDCVEMEVPVVPEKWVVLALIATTMPEITKLTNVTIPAAGNTSAYGLMARVMRSRCVPNVFGMKSVQKKVVANREPRVNSGNNRTIATVPMMKATRVFDGPPIAPPIANNK